jgi:hypothetical protein
MTHALKPGRRRSYSKLKKNCLTITIIIIIIIIIWESRFVIMHSVKKPEKFKLTPVKLCCTIKTTWHQIQKCPNNEQDEDAEGTARGHAQYLGRYCLECASKN